MEDRKPHPDPGELRAELAACRESLEQAETVVARHDDLLRTLLHELRTPTTALTSLVRLLGPAAEVDADVRRDAVELIALHVEHLHTLIDDVRELRRTDVLADMSADDGAISVLGDPRSPYRWRQVDVTTIVLIAADAAALARRRLDLEVSPAAARLHTDPARLRRVVTNLLENAARHGTPGEAVRVRARAVNGGFQLVIANGMPPGQQLETPSGDGIGLRIAERLVRSLDGRLDVDGDGAHRTATVHLPLDV